MLSQTLPVTVALKSPYSPLFTGLATLSYLLSGHEVLRLAVNKCVNIKSIVGKHS